MAPAGIVLVMHQPVRRRRMDHHVFGDRRISGGRPRDGDPRAEGDDAAAQIGVRVGAGFACDGAGLLAAAGGRLASKDVLDRDRGRRGIERGPGMGAVVFQQVRNDRCHRFVSQTAGIAERHGLLDPGIQLPGRALSPVFQETRTFKQGRLAAVVAACAIPGICSLAILRLGTGEGAGGRLATGV